MAAYQEKLNVEEAVTRPLWEPRHEWEARVKFVEDYVHDHGLEKAVNLSLVWANMQFLGCHYPPGTEALVKNYPMPSIEELKARRKCKESIAKYRHTSSSMSREKTTSFAEVSALLDSIHTQTSIKATHPQMQAISNETCLCKDCLGWSESETYSNKGLKILEHLKKIRKDIVCELTNKEDVWSLVINSEVVLKRKNSKELVLEDFMKMLNNWQEANQKPACPLVTVNQPQSEAGLGFQSESHSSESRYAGYSDRRQGGSYYQQGSTNWRGGGSYRY